MKSIRKCDEKVTAEELGVKIGDRFIVLSFDESFDEETHCNSTHIGDILRLKSDDGTSCPYFYSEVTGDYFYESFSCLSRYEEKPEPVETTIGEKIVTVVNAHFNDVESTGTYSTFEIKGLTAKQFNDILTFINNI